MGLYKDIYKEMSGLRYPPVKFFKNDFQDNLLITRYEGRQYNREKLMKLSEKYKSWKKQR